MPTDEQIVAASVREHLHEHPRFWELAKHERLLLEEALQGAVGGALEIARELAAQRDEARSQRDMTRRAFDKLEAAISHHRRDTEVAFAESADGRLWAARDKILKQLTEGTI